MTTNDAAHALASRRRAIAMKGQIHLERVAAVAAGRPFEPLPKKHRGRPPTS